MFLVNGSSETGFFSNLSNHVFRVGIFGNTKSMRVIFIFKIFKIQRRFQKGREKARKSFFVFEVIASQLVPLNFAY